MPRRSPYVGLAPFDADDAPYFFGRERDQEVVESNLYAARLSILYGPTGVGKSSVLLSGVVPRLVEAERAVVAVFREWQGEGFAEALKRSCLEAAGLREDGPLPLDDLLVRITEKTRRPVFVVLDQFEEYFNRPAGEHRDSFEAELARAVNRRDVEASFLVSLREDSIGLLDRFGRRIPRLLANRIRLGHLTLDGAERAIREPLLVWRERTGEEATIEDELVDEVLADVRAGSAEWLLAARERTHSAHGGGVEAPLLQLVLERLWLEGARNGGHALERGSYRDLGRAPGIARRHFADVLAALTPSQRELCERFFDRLVTPSGGKIAYPLADLEKVAGELAADVPATVKALDEGRILRRIELPDYTGVELYHDVLAPAVLEWRRRLADARARDDERRRRRRRALRLGLVAATVLLVALAALGAWYYDYRVDARPWAAMTDLATGRTSELTGNQAIVGRETPEIDVQVPLQPRSVSRLHLIVTRDDATALDVRSANGTSVNGEFIPYGDSRQLRAGDIVVVAGVAALRFEPLSYGRLELSPDLPERDPAAGWALVVDGVARTTHDVRADPAYVTLDGGEVGVSAARTPAAVAQIGRGTDGEEYVIDLPGGPNLTAEFLVLDEARRGIPNRGELDETGEAAYRSRGLVLTGDGARFQIVPTRPGD